MDFASALDRSAALRSKVFAMERAFAANPSDNGLRITLLSAKRLADRAERELQETAFVSGVDLCRYRVVRIDDNYPAAALGKSIVAYQDLFTALCDYVKNGAKSLARYTNEVRSVSTLNVGYTFPGSLGVLFTIENPRDLFNSGGLDQVVASLNELTDLQSISQVRTVAQKMGLNVVRNAYKWAEKNWEAEYAVDIKWVRSDAVTLGRMVNRGQFLKITSLIKQTEDEEPREFQTRGTLVGYNMPNSHFVVTTSTGRTYSGRLSDSFPRTEYRIPKEYDARILERTVTNYATEQSSTTYELLELRDASPTLLGG